jgi:hypothetical protein
MELSVLLPPTLIVELLSQWEFAELASILTTMMLQTTPATFAASFPTANPAPLQLFVLPVLQDIM